MRRRGGWQVLDMNVLQDERRMKMPKERRYAISNVVQRAVLIDACDPMDRDGITGGGNEETRT